MRKRQIIKINKLTPDLFKDLLEFMIYFKLSYPVGEYRQCGVQLDDAKGRIITLDTEYKCTDEIYLELYLASNKAIASIYKEINNYEFVQ